MDMKPLEVDSVDHGFMTPWSNKHALKSLQSPESGNKAIYAVNVFCFDLLSGECPDFGSLEDHQKLFVSRPADVVHLIVGFIEVVILI